MPPKKPSNNQTPNKSDKINPDNSEEFYDDNNFIALLDYLHSAKGHEIAVKVLSLVESVKKLTLDKNAEQTDKLHKNQYLNIWIQGIVIVIAVVAATALTYLGKFDTTIALFFGTLIGYFFGKK